MVLKNLKIVLENRVIENGFLVIENGCINRIGEGDYNQDALDCHDLIAMPGFIDIHIHGSAGFDFMDAKEDEYQHIAHADIGQVGSVEEAENDAKQSDEQHFKATIEDKWQAYDAGQTGGKGYGTFHGIDADPSLCAGTKRTKTGGFVVVASNVVEEVVDEVGINLHDECKEQAEQGCRRAKGVKLPGVEIGQCDTYHDGNGSAGQGLRTCGKYPSFK